MPSLKSPKKAASDKRGAEFRPFQTAGRFMVLREENWCLVDNLDSSLVGFETRKDAEESATFARAYVKKYGDIDLQSFPYGMDVPLSYDDYHDGEYRERAWYYGPNAPKNTFGAHVIMPGEEHLPIPPQPEWESGLD